jgi:ribonucleotide reductase class II
MMDLAMMGCGTGAIIEPHLINRLPAGAQPPGDRSAGRHRRHPAGERQETTTHHRGNRVEIKVGDTRRGWVTATSCCWS